MIHEINMLGPAAFCICRIKRMDESRLFKRSHLFVSLVFLCPAFVPILVAKRREEKVQFNALERDRTEVFKGNL